MAKGLMAGAGTQQELKLEESSNVKRYKALALARCARCTGGACRRLHRRGGQTYCKFIEGYSSASAA